MSEIDEEAYIVDSLAVVQKGKLRANAHKPHWLDMTLQEHLDNLEAEVRELKEAISGGFKQALVVAECADIANEAAMIADYIARRTGEGRSSYTGRLPRRPEEKRAEFADPPRSSSHGFASTRLASEDTP